MCVLYAVHLPVKDEKTICRKVRYRGIGLSSVLWHKDFDDNTNTATNKA